MISIETIAKELENRLNGNDKGYKFKVWSDTAKYQKAEREYNMVIETINCLLTAGTTDLSNLTDGNIIATQNYHFELLLRLENFEEDIQDEGFAKDKRTREKFEGNLTRIQNARKILSDICQENHQDLLRDENGKVFAVTTVYQFLQSGVREQRAMIGNSFSFSMNIYAMFIENGINTQGVKYYLDGKIIPFQANTTYQTPTLDSNVYANTSDGRAKALASQSSLTINFELPAIDNYVTRVITNFVFKNKLNEAHVLTIERDAENDIDAYFVTFGEARHVGETIKNIGQSITLFETVGDFELVEIPEKFYIYYCHNGGVTSIDGYGYCVESGQFTKGGTLDLPIKCHILTEKEQDNTNLTLSRVGKNG